MPGVWRERFEPTTAPAGAVRAPDPIDVPRAPGQSETDAPDAVPRQVQDTGIERLASTTSCSVARPLRPFQTLEVEGRDSAASMSARSR